MTGLTFIVFFVALKLQKYTSTGRFAAVDDDTAVGERGAHQPHLTEAYNWLLYGALCLILVDAHAIIYVASARPGAGARDALISAGLFAVDACALLAIRIVLIKYVMGWLLFYNKSWKSNPLTNADFWNNIDPAPNRPEAYDYAYD